jgi:hypothetical protein
MFHIAQAFDGCEMDQIVHMCPLSDKFDLILRGEGSDLIEISYQGLRIHFDALRDGVLNCDNIVTINDLKLIDFDRSSVLAIRHGESMQKIIFYVFMYNSQHGRVPEIKSRCIVEFDETVTKDKTVTKIEASRINKTGQVQFKIYLGTNECQLMGNENKNTWNWNEIRGCSLKFANN